MGANQMDGQIEHLIVMLVLLLATQLASHYKHSKQLKQLEDAVRDALNKQAQSE